MESKPHFTFESDAASGVAADADKVASSTNTHMSCAQDREQCFLTQDFLRELVVLLRPRPFRKRHPILFWAFIICIMLCITSYIFAHETTIMEENRLAVVHVEGTIMETQKLLAWVQKIAQDTSVKGVLLRIDSPGGGVAASEELYTALCALGDAKPLVASMGSTAASGGLMVAMAAKTIVANASTVTGSLGVRMDIPQLQGLLDKIGVGQEVLTTGKYKSAGSLTRPMTEEERQYLQNILQDMHEQFIAIVAKGRSIPLEKVRTFADGRIFTGRQALELGLVDVIGGQEEALKILREETHVAVSVPLYKQSKPSKFWEELAESVLGVDIQSLQPAFLYQ